ncbi:MAG: hypothetical protein QW728_03250 [Thermoplasmata archaeon]
MKKKEAVEKSASAKKEEKRRNCTKEAIQLELKHDRNIDTVARSIRWLVDNKIKHIARFVEEIIVDDDTVDPVRDMLLTSFFKKKRDALRLMRTRLILIVFLYLSIATTAISSVLMGISSLESDSLIRQFLEPLLVNIASFVGWFAVSLGSISIILSISLFLVNRSIDLVEADMLMIAMQIIVRSPRERLKEYRIYDDKVKKWELKKEKT